MASRDGIDGSRELARVQIEFPTLATDFHPTPEKQHDLGNMTFVFMSNHGNYYLLDKQ